MKYLIVTGMITTAALFLLVPLISWIECYKQVESEYEEENEWLGI